LVGFFVPFFATDAKKGAGSVEARGSPRAQIMTFGLSLDFILAVLGGDVGGYFA